MELAKIKKGIFDFVLNLAQKVSVLYQKQYNRVAKKADELWNRLEGFDRKYFPFFRPLRGYTRTGWKTYQSSPSEMRMITNQMLKSNMPFYINYLLFLAFRFLEICNDILRFSLLTIAKFSEIIIVILLRLLGEVYALGIFILTFLVTRIPVILSVLLLNVKIFFAQVITFVQINLTHLFILIQEQFKLLARVFTSFFG